MPRATPTRDRIVETARQLFNEAGITAVTTNHIAARATLSPGNLYYYFSNKEQIIVELVNRLDEHLERTWRFGAEHPPSRADLEPLLEQRFIVLDEYAGVAREILVLARYLPRVRERYRVFHDRRVRELDDVFCAWIEGGEALPLGSEQRRELAETAWLLALSLVSGSNLIGEHASGTARRDAERIAELIVAQLFHRQSQ